MNKVMEILLDQRSAANDALDNANLALKDYLFPVLLALGKNLASDERIDTVYEGVNGLRVDTVYEDGSETDSYFIYSGILDAANPEKAAREFHEAHEELNRDIQRKSKMAEIERLQRELENL